MGTPPPERVELPADLAAPARRALRAAGYETLEQLASAPDEELRRLHGVGPKALRQIRAALAAAGLTTGDA